MASSISVSSASMPLSVRGGAGIVFGLIALFLPGLTPTSLLLAFAAYSGAIASLIWLGAYAAPVFGIALVIKALRMRREHRLQH